MICASANSGSYFTNIAAVHDAKTAPSKAVIDSAGGSRLRTTGIGGCDRPRLGDNVGDYGLASSTANDGKAVIVGMQQKGNRVARINDRWLERATVYNAGGRPKNSEEAMGQAKQRARAQVNAHQSIEEELRGFGINTAEFGFYDQQAFLEREQMDGQFLEKYAQWVDTRPRSAEYDARARIIVPKLASFMADLFEKEGMQRSCVHVSSMLPRILDRMGIWSFGLMGSFVAEVTEADLWRGQASCDVIDFPGAQRGHAWVVAPPFVIVDATIRLQNPQGDPMNDYLPEIVAAEDAALTKATVDDVVSAELRRAYAEHEGRSDSQLHHRLVPQLRKFSQSFPSREITIGQAVLRYVPTGVRVSDLPLEEINSAGEKLIGAEVWDEHIVPNFAEYILPKS
jgi:hypothetical protein